MKDFSDELSRLCEALENADAIVVGAGAGLSASAGFEYGGDSFARNFPDLVSKYGLSDMYSAGFYPYDTDEEFWGFWSRSIMINRYTGIPKPKVFSDLLGLVGGKEYFVITTNVDHCFQQAGFDKERLFYTQGDYGLFQCSKPCRQETYDNFSAVMRMAAGIKDGKIRTEDIPRCPICGRKMVPNLRSDGNFVEDRGWHRASARYRDFIGKHSRGRTVYLELGVGSNTPGIIKYPFWDMAAGNRSSVYACVNLGQAYAPKEILGRSILIDMDIGAALEKLSEKRSSES